MQGRDGSFYGVTGNLQTPNDNGTVYRINPGGMLTTLYSFGGSDGSSPYGTLVQGTDGSFYGTTFAGGAYGYGTVYRITPGGVLTTLHSFDSQNDGSAPQGGLVMGGDGSLYGTTTGETGTGLSTVFRITPDGILTTLHKFGFSDGTNPIAALVQASDGSFYGTTSSGGANSDGTVFRLVPNASFFTGETTLSNGVSYLALPNGNDFGYYSILSNPNYGSG